MRVFKATLFRANSEGHCRRYRVGISCGTAESDLKRASTPPVLKKNSERLLQTSEGRGISTGVETSTIRCSET